MAVSIKQKTQIISDNETKVDYLSNEAISSTIIKLLLDHPERPITIGVHGDWGAGKSSVLEMIESGLETEDSILCLKFNGWRFQGFEDAKIALLDGIVNALAEKRPKLIQVTEKVKNIIRRIDWYKAVKNIGGLALSISTGIPPITQIQNALLTIDAMVRNPDKRPSQSELEEALDNAHSILKPDNGKNLPEEIDEFRKEFDNLLEQAKITRLVVLIDDLDRCLPETAIETLEAIRLFIFTKCTAFVIAADESMIEYAVQNHFPDLPSSSGPQSYARNYLEKLIQIPIRIPPLGVTETQIFVTLILIGAELDDNDADFNNLIEASREILKRPWSSQVIDSELIKEIMGDKASQAIQALNLSIQIGPILANGTKGNPRQIKRFLNALLLRKYTADARGFGDEITLRVLAKLMLAEQFLPTFFEQIANRVIISQEGICEELQKLESLSSTIISQLEVTNAPLKSSTKPIKKEQHNVDEQVREDNIIVNKWKEDPQILNWAKLQPPLGSIDLRPYLFVTKDRKNFFGITTALGPLAKLVELLLGPRIILQGKEEDIKKLSLTEASEIFTQLRRRVIEDDSYKKEPSGIAGMSLLVKTHSELEVSLLDFLETLPEDKLGSWVVTGWGELIHDDKNIKRLTDLLQKWGESTNPILKSAANSVVKLRLTSNKGK